MSKNPPRPVDAQLLFGSELYQTVVLEKLVHARETVLISTANVKAMLVEIGASGAPFKPIVDLFATLSARGVDVRLLHAELPSRPFRQAFDKHEALVAGGLHLKICPRVHFKTVIIDGGWMYVGSANLTGAGLGAKHADTRNFELGVVTEDFDFIDRVTALFESVWGGSECAKCRLHSICPDPIGPGPKRAGKRGGKVGITLGRSRRFRK